MTNFLVPVDNPDGDGVETGTASTLTWSVFSNNSGFDTLRGKTLWVAVAGTAFSSLAVQGSFDNSNWVTAKDIAWTDCTCSTGGQSHRVIGASYPYLRVATTGGDSTSTLTAKVIG